MVFTTAALLLLVVTLLLATTAADAAAAAAGHSCPTNCGLIDFSYPFGIGPACSLPGFNLTCDANTYGNQLLLGNPNATVDYMKISASGSISAVAVHVIRSVNMTPGAGVFSASWDGPGRPFAISGTSNMSLFVLGCGVTATLVDRATGDVVGNCSVVCAGEQVMRRLPDGLCGGVGCCRIDVRVHLRAFTLNVSRTGDGVSRDRLSFLVTGRDGYTFRPSVLEDNIDANMVPPALLDWAIPDRSDCQRAMEDRASYACVSNHSQCQDSQIGGYVCHCYRGFFGNPYVVDGCIPDQGNHCISVLSLTLECRTFFIWIKYCSFLNLWWN